MPVKEQVASRKVVRSRAPNLLKQIHFLHKLPTNPNSQAPITNASPTSTPPSRTSSPMPQPPKNPTTQLQYCSTSRTPWARSTKTPTHDNCNPRTTSWTPSVSKLTSIAQQPRARFQKITWWASSVRMVYRRWLRAWIGIWCGLRNLSRRLLSHLCSRILGWIVQS